MVIAQHGIIGTGRTSVDISYLSDTIILVRYLDLEGAVPLGVPLLRKPYLIGDLQTAIARTTASV